MKFLGYRRKNGDVGVRNHILVFPTVICSSTVAQIISSQIPDTVYVTHSYGCGHLGEDKDRIRRAMIGFTANPNVGGVLLVGLGCELFSTQMIGEELIKRDRNVEIVNIQDEGGTTKAVEKGVELAKKLLQRASSAKREPVDVAELVIGVHNGASDTLSGLSANPALGIATDLVIKEGGTVIMSETAEVLGAEHILAERIANDHVKEHFLKIIGATESRISAMSVDICGTEPSPGNIIGGLTTIEEKSLGSIRKAGTTEIVQVIKYAEAPSKRGLIMMDAPSFHVISITGMLSSGAHIIVFSTGRGTPLGLPIAPVIKVSSNTATYDRMRDNIDLNAGSIIEGTETEEIVGNRIFREILDVASGKFTKAELLGHREFALYASGAIP